MSSWTPGQRAKQRALEQPYPDVPPHLKHQLLEWVGDVAVRGDGSGEERVAKATLMRLRLADPPTRRSGNTLMTAADATSDGLLDIIEDLLEYPQVRWGTDPAERLEELLSAGNSAYRVRSDKRGLEMRLTPGVAEQAQAVVDTVSGSAGDHLAEAWNEAYGRNPDPVKAYSESIKAVESALAPIVAPKDKLATLGKMIGSISQAPHKWEFILVSQHVPNVDTVLNLLRSLWDGQTSRHGGITPTRHETLEEARAAVGIAVTVVQFCSSGAFSSKTPPVPQAQQ